MDRLHYIVVRQRFCICNLTLLIRKIVRFFPKFHCELNFIERIWGYLKASLRRTLVVNFEDLKIKLLEKLENLPLSYVRKVARSCLRFMSGYRMGLVGPLLDYTMKKYSGHRIIPRLCEDAMDALGREWENKKKEFNEKKVGDKKKFKKF